VTALEPGHSFAGYQLVERISRGGMGEVWRATKPGPEGWRKTVALKVILPAMADEERFGHMFLREARIAAQLDHPNIVPVFAFGKDGERLWFEQELIAGHDLAHWIRRGRRFPIPIALFVVGELLAALDYAHSRTDDAGVSLHIVHRDIKPHNVLVADEGHVKLVDFGIAKIAADATASHSTIKGTAGYLAPEVLEGRQATPASDLFGVGVVLWELLTMRKLFPGDSDAARIKATLQNPLPRLSNADIEAPEALDRFVRRLLARNPFDRPQTADAAHHALLALPGARAAGSRELRELLAERAGAPNRDTGKTAPQTPRARAAHGRKSDGVPIAVDGDAATPGAPMIARTATAPPEPAPSSAAVALMSAETRTAVAATGTAPTSPTGTLSGEVSKVTARAAARRTYLGAGAALVAVAVLGGWLVARSRQPATTDGATTPTAAELGDPVAVDAAHAAPAPAPAIPDDAAAEAVAAVRVILDVAPPDARVEVNGVRLPGTSPFTWTGEPNTEIDIVARRRRYRTVHRSVTTGRDDDRIAIEMERATQRERPAPAPPTPGRDKDAIFLPE
jgi:serine/threonine-protein kinase